MKNCLRCGKDEEPSIIGALLFNFTCDSCRCENNPWHWGTDVKIEAMEAQLPSANSEEEQDEVDE